MSYEIANPEDINSNILVIDEIPPYDIKDYDLFEEKDFKKYLFDIEGIVRSSMEYREFINYMRDYMDMSVCSFFENVSNNDTYKIKIHLHHHPLTLFDVVVIIFKKRSYYEESLEIEMVAKEVMYIHYFLMIGLIPLSETVHDLVHAGFIHIPIKKVMGNWEEFLETYAEFVPPEVNDKIYRFKNITESLAEEKNRQLLTQSPTYVKLELETNPDSTEVGTYKTPTMDDIIDAMNLRIQQLKEQDRQIEQKNTVDMTYDSISPEDKKVYRPIYFVD
ncbi:MAG: hypothetical protein PHC62_00800 [Candidatus Izemoplasmatales bacterium]|nr:hypothetical protein [Candidatus Izemoplasmatales bacterium]